MKKYPKFSIKINDNIIQYTGIKGENTLVQKIQKAAVLGSGVMGSGIAAHLANIGIPTILLDIVPRELREDEKKKGLTLEDKTVRNRMGQTAITAAIKTKASPLHQEKILS